MGSLQIVKGKSCFVQFRKLSDWVQQVRHWLSTLTTVNLQNSSNEFVSCWERGRQACLMILMSLMFLLCQKSLQINPEGKTAFEDHPTEEWDNDPGPGLSMVIHYPISPYFTHFKFNQLPQHWTRKTCGYHRKTSSLDSKSKRKANSPFGALDSMIFKSFGYLHEFCRVFLGDSPPFWNGQLKKDWKSWFTMIQI